jgi:hypothetical protein
MYSMAVPPLKMVSFYYKRPEAVCQEEAPEGRAETASGPPD